MNVIKRILVFILLIFVMPKAVFPQNASENNIENNINFTAWTMSVDLISKLDSIVYSYAVGLIDDVSLFTKWLIVETDRNQNAGMKLVLEFYRTSDILKEIMGIADSDINLINEAELNRDRGDRPYGIIAGEERKYGLCDFEVDFKADVVEVREDIRGDVARVWLYMSDKYKFDIPEEQLNIFLLWHRLDPPSDTERKRDKKIKELQGDSNPYVADCQ